MCPECGMQLFAVEEPLDKLGARKSLEVKPQGKVHDRHAGHPASNAGHATGHGKTDSFLKKFWISLALTIPVILYSDVFQQFSPIKPPMFFGVEFLPLIFGSIVFFYGGWVFIRSAVQEIHARMPGMMTLIALAISSAYFYSVYSVLIGSSHTLFWELTTLITIMLLGHWIEMRAVQGAQGALKELSKLLPDTAEVVRGGNTTTIPLSELRESDVVVVRPGGRIPADGRVIDGSSHVDESMITGESMPVSKIVGAQVIAGTINGDGALKFSVASVGEHTFFAGVMRLVREAQASKSRLQILSDKAAYYLTIVAIGAGGVAFLAWIVLAGDVSMAFERLVAVLVIACPHALGLAVPLVASISTTMAARNGFLVRQRLALEMARNINIVLFDKTGTLTKGEYGVTNIWADSTPSTTSTEPVPSNVEGLGAGEQVNEKNVLQLAASVDAHSEHYISRALVNKAKQDNLSFFEVKDFSRVPGRGVSGIIDGRKILVGGAAILDGASVPSSMEKEIERESKKGKTIIYILRDNNVIGAFALADLIRDESREAIASLRQMGVKVGMLTGDSEDVASWVAHDLGIDEYFARVLPQDKAAKVKILQAKNVKVAMVGDGINDAPALVQADLGVAIGAGTNVAIESAGIILVKNDPRDIAKIITLSRLTYSKMVQNLFWAAGYNVVALPLAAGILAPWGIVLQPAVAAVLMSLSTVIVAFNAMLLRRNTL